MKYRLVIDNDADMSYPWYVVQEWLPMLKQWSRVDSGKEEYCRKVYERLLAGKDKYTVVDCFDPADTKSLFKAREAKADLGL